jgi:hypothetical protein
MRTQRSLLSLAIAGILGFATTTVPALTAEHEHTLKIGKKGAIILDAPTKVGALTLKAGKYQVVHRTEGEDHFIHFAESSKLSPYDQSGGEVTSHPGEVKCRVEPIDKKAQYDMVTLSREDGGYRLLKIWIAGEKVAHLF